MTCSGAETQFCCTSSLHVTQHDLQSTACVLRTTAAHSRVASMQLRKRKAAAEHTAAPMQLARQGARALLTDTFRARKRVEHVTNGKRAVTRAVVKETTSAIFAAATGTRAASAARVSTAKTQEGTPPAPAEGASAGEAGGDTVTAEPFKRRRRVAKSAVKAAAATGVAEAALDAIATPAPPLPPLNPERIAAGVAHLASVNARLAELISEYGPPERLVPCSGGSTFAALTRSIVSQQLATGAARTIFGRFLLACKTVSSEAEAGAEVSPNAVLAAPLMDLRAAGLSGQKAAYITDLAAHYADGRLTDAALQGMTEDEVIAKLTDVKGIGVWTAQMYLIFSAGRPDVLPVGDLGVRKGIQICFGLKELPDAAKMEALTASWQPWRSIGSWYMWRLAEAEGKRTPKEAAERPATAAAAAAAS